VELGHSFKGSPSPSISSRLQGLWYQRRWHLRHAVRRGLFGFQTGEYPPVSSVDGATAFLRPIEWEHRLTWQNALKCNGLAFKTGATYSKSSVAELKSTKLQPTFLFNVSIHRLETGNNSKYEFCELIMNCNVLFPLIGTMESLMLRLTGIHILGRSLYIGILLTILLSYYSHRFGKTNCAHQGVGCLFGEKLHQSDSSCEQIFWLLNRWLWHWNGVWWLRSHHGYLYWSATGSLPGKLQLECLHDNWKLYKRSFEMRLNGVSHSRYNNQVYDSSGYGVYQPVNISALLPLELGDKVGVFAISGNLHEDASNNYITRFSCLILSGN